MANTYKILPILLMPEEKELTVALDSPDNFRATDDLSTLMGFKLYQKLAMVKRSMHGLAKYYGGKEETINELIGEVEGDAVPCGV